eukprot:scaffold1263_cov100-Isochrysis_galbana.AAC.2
MPHTWHEPKRGWGSGLRRGVRTEHKVGIELAALRGRTPPSDAASPGGKARVWREQDSLQEGGADAWRSGPLVTAPARQHERRRRVLAHVPQLAPHHLDGRSPLFQPHTPALDLAQKGLRQDDGAVGVGRALDRAATGQCYHRNLEPVAPRSHGPERPRGVQPPGQLPAAQAAHRGQQVLPELVDAPRAVALLALVVGHLDRRLGRALHLPQQRISLRAG